MSELRNLSQYVAEEMQRRKQNSTAVSPRRARDELLKNRDVLIAFLKRAESEYGFNMKQYDPVMGFKYRKTKKDGVLKPTPTSEQFYSMWDQDAYNTDREQRLGKSRLNFGTPDYNPYDHSDDDNEVYGDFVGSFHRTPNQQEFETRKTQYLTDKKTKAAKEVAGLLDVPYVPGDDYAPNNWWQQLGLGYDTLDTLDLKRSDMGLPPKAYLERYNRSDPEDVLRLKRGEAPKFYDNTAKAQAEFQAFRQMVMQMADSNQAVDADSLYALYANGAFPTLRGYEQFRGARSKVQQSAENSNTPEYDAMIGKATKLPREPLDEAALAKAGWSEDWLQKLADEATAAQKQKYGMGAKAAGWIANTFGKAFGFGVSEPEQQAADVDSAVSQAVQQYAQAESKPQDGTLGWNGDAASIAFSTPVESKLARLGNGRYVVSQGQDGKFYLGYMEDGKTYTDAMNGVTYFYDTLDQAKEAAQRNAAAIAQGQEPPRGFGEHLFNWTIGGTMRFLQLPQSAAANVLNLAFSTVKGRPFGEGAKLNMTFADYTKRMSEVMGGPDITAEIAKAGPLGAIANFTLDQLSDPLNYLEGGAVFDILKAKGMLNPKNLQLIKNEATKAQQYVLNPKSAGIRPSTAKEKQGWDQSAQPAPAEIAQDVAQAVDNAPAAEPAPQPESVRPVQEHPAQAAPEAPRQEAPVQKPARKSAPEPAYLPRTAEQHFQMESVAEAPKAAATQGRNATADAATRASTVTNRGEWQKALGNNGDYAYISIGDGTPYIMEKGNNSALFYAVKNADGTVDVVPSFSADDMANPDFRKLFDVDGDPKAKGYTVVKPARGTYKGEQFIIDQKGEIRYGKTEPPTAGSAPTPTTRNVGVSQAQIEQVFAKQGIVLTDAEKAALKKRLAGQNAQHPMAASEIANEIIDARNAAAREAWAAEEARAAEAEKPQGVENKPAAGNTDPEAPPWLRKQEPAGAEKPSAGTVKEEIFTPQRDVEAKLGDGEDALSVTEKEGDLTPMQEYFLDDFARTPGRREEIARQLDDIRDGLNADIENVVRYMDDTKKQGVALNSDAAYYSGGEVKRISNNERWYRQLFKEKGREPSHARIREAAVELMLDKNSEFYSPDFADAFNYYKEMKPFVDRLDAGGAIQAVEKLPDGTVKVRYGEAAASTPEIHSSGAKLAREMGGEAEAAYYGYGSMPKSLIDSFLGFEAEAKKAGTPKAVSIAKKAREVLDGIMGELRTSVGKTDVSMKQQRQLDLIISGHEKKLGELVGQLQDEVKAVQAKAKADLKALRDTKNAKLDAAEQKRQADVLAMRVKKNEEMLRKLDKLEAKRRADLVKLREQKNTAVQRTKTSALLKDLQGKFDNKEQRPLRPGLKDALSDFLPAMDSGKLTGRVESTRLTKWLEKARDGTTGDKLVDEAAWGDDAQYAIDVLHELHGRAVKSLSAAELKDLRKAMHSIEHLDKSAYQVIVDGHKAEAKAVAGELLGAVSGHKDVSPQLQTGRTVAGKPRLIDRIGDYFGYAAMEPENVANIIMNDTKGNTLVQKLLSKAMERGGWKHAEYRLADHEALTGLMQGVDKNTWFHARKEYTLPSGQKVRLTQDELAGIYMNSKNADNRASLVNQIRVEVPGKKNQSLTFTLTEMDADALIKIAEADPQVKRVGDGLFKWNAEQVSGRINEASQQRFGYDMADVEDYWPIRRDTQEMPKNFAVMGRTLETFGWQQKRVNSHLPIVLDGAMSTAVRMSEESALFGSYAVPVKNMQRVIRIPEVQKALRAKFGDAMIRYFDTYFREGIVKQGGKADRGASAVLWLSRSAQAAILATPKVVLNQFAGIASAAGYLDLKYLPKAIAKRANLGLMKKWAPMMYERRVLGGSPEAGALMDMGILPETGVDKIRSTMTRGIQWGDTVTMDLAWNWSELQTRAKYPHLNGDAFWAKVGETAQEVVGRTQPTNETGYRSVIENTKSPLEKLALPFTSGTNKVYNMMVDAALSFKTGNKARAASRVMGVVANGVAFAVVSTLWGRLWRGKDDQPFLNDLLSNFADNMVTAPYLGNIVSGAYRAISGNTDYNVRVIALDTINDGVNAVGSIKEASEALTEAYSMAEKTPDERKKRDAAIKAAQARVAGGIKQLSTSIAPVFGVPVAQFERDILLPILRIAGPDAYYGYQGAFKADDGAQADFRSAVDNGNTAKARSILEHIVGDKGKADVQEWWRSSSWFKALPAEKQRELEGILRIMQQRKP